MRCCVGCEISNNIRSNTTRRWVTTFQKSSYSVSALVVFTVCVCGLRSDLFSLCWTSAQTSLRWRIKKKPAGLFLRFSWRCYVVSAIQYKLLDRAPHNKPPQYIKARWWWWIPLTARLMGLYSSLYVNLFSLLSRVSRAPMCFTNLIDCIRVGATHPVMAVIIIIIISGSSSSSSTRMRQAVSSSKNAKPFSQKKNVYNRHFVFMYIFEVLRSRCFARCCIYIADHQASNKFQVCVCVMYTYKIYSKKSVIIFAMIWYGPQLYVWSNIIDSPLFACLFFNFSTISSSSRHEILYKWEREGG